MKIAAYNASAVKSWNISVLHTSHRLLDKQTWTRLGVLTSELEPLWARDLQTQENDWKIHLDKRKMIGLKNTFG
jgi:hypothetical protein